MSDDNIPGVSTDLHGPNWETALTVEKLCRVLRALTAKDRADAQQKAVDGQGGMYINWAALADALEVEEEETTP